MTSQSRCAAAQPGLGSHPALSRRAKASVLRPRGVAAILNLYGRKVAEGEWRDYAIDFLDDKAVFSIYRRTSEVPLYRIEKDPKLAKKQGAYSVVVSTGLILKRGHELDRVLTCSTSR